MEEQSLAVSVAPARVSRRKHGNRLLIMAIVLASLACFAILGLLVQSVVTVNSQPLQTVAERDAVVAVDRAESNPGSVEAQMAAASALILTEENDKALKYAERAMRINPQSPSAKLVKARALQVTGELGQARTLLDEVRAGEDKGSALYASASLILAVIDEAEGRLAQAVENLKVAQAGDPTNAEILVQLGRLQEATDAKDDAAASYGQALQYIPDFEPALTALRAMKTGTADYQLAKAAWLVGDKEEAARLMEQAAAGSPEVAWLQVALGEFRRMIDDKEGAKAAFEKALTIEPANEEAKAGLDSLK